jgi:hypothetical protein
VLDEQVVDSDGVNAGRIDGIVLSIRDDEPPRVAYIEVSPITMLARFSLRLARWYARFDRRFAAERGRPFRIPWSTLRREPRAFRLNSKVAQTPIDAVDRWLGEKIVDRIPGG